MLFKAVRSSHQITKLFPKQLAAVCFIPAASWYPRVTILSITISAAGTIHKVHLKSSIRCLVEEL